MAEEYLFLNQLARELHVSVRAGAALAALTLAAGCGGEATSVEEAPGDSLPGTSTETTSTDTISTDTAQNQSLEVYSLDRVGCLGPISDDPDWGPQCCFTASCYTPDAGAACATNLHSAELSFLRTPNSGVCGCNVPSEGLPGVAGPFAPNPADDSVRREGSCCYLVGRIGCTGRPLVVQGTLQVAPLVERADWASPELTPREPPRSERVA